MSLRRVIHRQPPLEPAEAEQGFTAVIKRVAVKSGSALNVNLRASAEKAIPALGGEQGDAPQRFYTFPFHLLLAADSLILNF